MLENKEAHEQPYLRATVLALEHATLVRESHRKMQFNHSFRYDTICQAIIYPRHQEAV